MKKEMYIVTMYKYANREAHSYVLGVWGKKYQAMKFAGKEENDRGGKYIAEIIEVIPDQACSGTEKTIVLNPKMPIGRESNFDYGLKEVSND